MAFQDFLLLGLLVFLTSFPSNSISVAPSHSTASFNRHSFPAGFIFGSSSSAYQYEGAANEGGKGPSIWDTYTHKHPERISDGSNGDVAIDQYHHYKEDVGIMKEVGLDAYRFSIAWSRVLPKGKLSAGVNKEGIQYYNNLINELLSNGIKPFATIFHWDVPQALEDEYGGFLSPRIADDFGYFADLCFKEFGDRVKQWITLNEPWSFSSLGYGIGKIAPGRCSSWQKLNCTGGDSATEPYLVTHHLILAHAAAVKVYKQKYQDVTILHKVQAAQKGSIGITLVSQWMVPVSEAKHNRNAAQRALDFMFGWFLDPLTYGHYPHSMRSLVGKRLPKFTEEQSKLVKGSFDFLGINYYSAYYAAYAPYLGAAKSSYSTDSRVNLTYERNGIPIGKPDAANTIYLYPKGLLDLLLYTKEKYQNPTIYITENGIDELNNASLPLEVALVDKQRIEYHNLHLWYLNKAIKSGVKVKGYFAWTLLDDFEWYSGFTLRMGHNYVDYKNGLKRYPKLSVHWLKNFLKK